MAVIAILIANPDRARVRLCVALMDGTAIIAIIVTNRAEAVVSVLVANHLDLMG